MEIKRQIEILQSKDNRKAYKALNDLLAISEKENTVYSYFDCFVEMVNNQNNSFIRTRGLRLIAYNSKWDVDNKINLIIIDWLNHIEDDKPITSRQCIKDSVMIAKNKPALVEAILDALNRIDKIYDKSMQNIIYKDRQKAIQQIKQSI